MTTRTDNRSAARAFAALADATDKTLPRTHTDALSFRTYAAFSYAEPIAIVDSSGVLLVTDARFSVTTSKHTGLVAGTWAIEHGSDTVRTVDHSTLRARARAIGYSVGARGDHYDRPVRND